MPISAEVPETDEILTPKAGIVQKSEVIKNSLERLMKRTVRTYMQTVL